MESIMVDMDDVITYGNFAKIVEDYLGYRPDFESIKGYYVQDVIFGDNKADFFDKFKDMDLYDGATLLEGCYEVLRDLNLFYKIYICTDYIWRDIPAYAGNNLKNKYRFLFEQLNFLDPHHFIFAGDKSIINTTVKIDDKVSNIEGASKKLLYTAWHNKDISEEELRQQEIIRVNDWYEIGGILLPEGHARKRS